MLPRSNSSNTQKDSIMSEIRFDGKVAIVTGAGGGLGKTYALQLAERGAKVVVNDLGGATDGTGGGSSMADQTVKEIVEAGGEAVANYDSVATPDGGESIVKAAVDSFGRIDAVINNAGILRDKTFAKLEPQNLEAVVDVHMKGAFFVTQPAFRLMKDQGYGRIVLVSSNAGLLGNFGQTNYGAAKASMAGLANVLALEGAKYNIKVNVLAPIARTRMTEDLLGELIDALDPACVTPLVTYLVSDQCEYTANIWSAGGGRYARMFIGLTQGWYAGKSAVPSPEEIRDHVDEIRDETGYVVPESIAEEMKILLDCFNNK